MHFEWIRFCNFTLFKPYKKFTSADLKGACVYKQIHSDIIYLYKDNLIEYSINILTEYTCPSITWENHQNIK